MTWLKRSQPEEERKAKAFDVLDELDAMVKRITDVTDTIDPVHLNGKDPKP